MYYYEQTREMTIFFKIYDVWLINANFQLFYSILSTTIMSSRLLKSKDMEKNADYPTLFLNRVIIICINGHG